MTSPTPAEIAAVDQEDAELSALLDRLPGPLGSPSSVARIGRPPIYTPEVARDRQREQSRRTNMALARARATLTERHRDEYLALLAEAREAVYAECGPLPGDPDASER
jgi:hypothetical protein